jgi:hypothetical protein
MSRSAYFFAVLACWIGASPLALSQVAAPAPQGQEVLVVVGAAGEDDYRPQFQAWAEKWRAAAERGSAAFSVIGVNDGDAKSDRDQLKQWLAQSHDGASLIWLVLIGHGTFDGKAAKFNLRGPDVAAEELAQWLAPIKAPLAVIDCASASAPFINALSGKDRVVVTATKSGDELNFARFGQFMAEAIADPRADLDKDDQVSLLEAYLTACRNVAEFYQSERRLATEHALLDDNGDGLGTPAEWFRGVRAMQRTKEGAALDGVRAHQIHLVPSDREARLPAEMRKRRDDLELAVAALREEKERLPADEYYQRLDGLMVQLAELYAAHQSAPSPAAPAAPQAK